jgi:phage tail-like protein
VQDIVIYLQDDSHSDVANWTLVNAWPCKYTAPDFNASSSEVAFESVELAFEEMTRNQ